MKKQEKLEYRSTFLKRMLQLILIPTFVAQMSSIYIFYQRYWNKLSNSNASLIMQEIDSLNKYYNRKINTLSVKEILQEMNLSSSFEITFQNNNVIDSTEAIKKNIFHKRNFFLFTIQNLLNIASNIFKEKTSLNQDKNGNFIFNIEKETGILSFHINKKRIFISNIRLIVFWNIFAFLFISFIVILFVKNQVKSIVKLKNFINDFSYLEKDTIDFKPTGAKEIREIGIAFINMIKKIKSFFNTKTIMLAQISHDLRTPITRMKLQTEFIDNEDIKVFFKKNLSEMEKMVNEYILFAKGEMTTEFQKVNIKTFLTNIVNDYINSGYENIYLNFSLKTEECLLKTESFKRAVNNLINNALKYRNKGIYISAESNSKNLYITVEDDGKEEIDKKIFLKNNKKPFMLLNNSDKKSSSGLGLSIVQQIVSSHRGRIDFEKSKKFGGLLVKITVPVNNK